MIKAGGEVDSFCTKCNMDLAHVVIAVVDGRPVKVQCNTCHAVHRYRGELARTSAARRTSAAAPRAARERPTTISFDEVLRSKNLAMAQPYSSKASYQLDQVIEHPTFGLGWVSAVRDATKVEVTFRGEVKVLIHGKALASAAPRSASSVRSMSRGSGAASESRAPVAGWVSARLAACSGVRSRSTAPSPPRSTCSSSGWGPPPAP